MFEEIFLVVFLLFFVLPFIINFPRIERPDNKRAQKYAQIHEAKTFLSNSYCCCYMLTSEVYYAILCKRNSSKWHRKETFAIVADKKQIATIWLYIQMEFSNAIKYASIKSFAKGYDNINVIDTTLQDILPWNEFWSETVRMIFDDKKGDAKIICSELFSDNNKNKTFIMQGERMVLSRLFSDFTKETKQTKTYEELLLQYKKYPNIKVIENVKQIAKPHQTQIPNMEKQETKVEVIKPAEPPEPAPKPRYDERNVDF